MWTEREAKGGETRVERRACRVHGLWAVVDGAEGGSGVEAEGYDVRLRQFGRHGARVIDKVGEGHAAAGGGLASGVEVTLLVAVTLEAALEGGAVAARLQGEDIVEALLVGGGAVRLHLGFQRLKAAVVRGVANLCLIDAH
eukprot:5093059-Prymnesium_polylepis.2